MTEKDFKYFKDYLDNMEMEVFMKRGARIQAMLRDVPTKHLQALDENGGWYCNVSQFLLMGLRNGMVYRVNPNWEGPKDPVEPKLDPSPEYRLLEVGEVLQAGDEYQSCGQWTKTNDQNSKIKDNNYLRYRRKIAAPAVKPEQAKPPAPRYVDLKPVLCSGSWVLKNGGYYAQLKDLRVGFNDVLGFVYGTTVKRTIRLVRVMDVVGVAGYEIVVPDAVRFRV